MYNQHIVLVLKEAQVHLIASQHAQNVSIAMCVNTAAAFSPMIIFKGPWQKPAFHDGLPAGSFVNLIPKGSMITELFVELIKHLTKYKSWKKHLVNVRWSDIPFKLYGC